MNHGQDARATLAMKARREGFTLLELLVVMGLMIALSVMALVAYKGMMSGTGVGAAGTHLSQILQLSRQMAMVQGKNIYVVFHQDSASAWYTVCRGEGIRTSTGSPSSPSQTLGDQFNTELGQMKVGTLVYNLSSPTGVCSAIESRQPDTAVTLSNAIWTSTGEAYGWEVRPKIQLPYLFKFGNPLTTGPATPLTIRFKPEGVVCSWDGTASSFTINMYEATRTNSFVTVSISSMGAVKCVY